MAGNLFFGRGFMQLFVVNTLMAVLSLALLGVYTYHIFSTDRLKSDMKVLWFLAVLFLSIPAMLVYFYLHIWKEKKKR